MSEKITIIGAGAWGSALAQACALAKNEVSLICQFQKDANEINKTQKNKEFLGEQILSDKITAYADYEQVKNASIVLMVVPAQVTSLILKAIPSGYLDNKPVLLCAKGLEEKTLFRQSEILENLVPLAKTMVLSGPSFAKDVAKGLPTAITLAGKDKKESKQVALSLASATFRPYISDDLIGVELAGSLKNVYALACGAVDGAGLGLSARSALIARSYAEMRRIILAFGGQSETLGSLAGIGDLTLSCTSNQSRNYWFGQQLGMGKSVEEIKASGAKLAEGVISAPVAKALAKTHNIDVPLIDAVNALLEGDIDIKQIVISLMRRPLKEEGK